VKASIWDIFSTILIATSLVMGSVFFIIYQYPNAKINPFPPPTQADISFLPSITPSLMTLPDIWTPIPDLDEAANPNGLDEQSVETEWPDGETTNTPVLVITQKPTTSGTQSPSEQKSSNIILPTKNPLEPTTEEEAQAQTLIVTAPIGVFNNVWQNIQSIPSFSWGTNRSVQEIDHFLVYFGTKQNGNLTIKTTKMHKTWKAATSGIYYFRILAVAKDGTVIGKPSSFLFKYDVLPPTKPTNFLTLNTGDTDLPYFTWTESKDVHSGMIGGMAGYSIYQGTIDRCGKPVAFTSATNWTPVTPVAKGATMYFCVKAMDAIGNESEWVGPVPYTVPN
jgi:hypothetical protein